MQNAGHISIVKHSTIPGVALIDVDAASAAALPACTYNGGAKTLTEDANGALTLDGVTVQDNDVVVIKDQADLTQNGIYTVTDKGGAGTPFILTRNTSYDTTAELLAANGKYFHPTAGTANSDAVLQIAFAGVMDTDDVTFTDLGDAVDLYTVGDSEIDVRPYVFGLVRVPSAWTGARIGFLMAVVDTMRTDYAGEAAPEYVYVKDSSGNWVVVTGIDTAEAGWYEIPDAVMKGGFIKPVSVKTGSEALEPQLGDRDLVFFFKA